VSRAAESLAAEPRPVAVLTGASSGIGAALAAELAAAGWSLMLVARREAPLQQVAAALRARGADVLVTVGDVAERAVCERMVAAALARWQRLDAVVANAGAYDRGTALAATEASVTAALRANFWTGFHAAAAALPALRASRGQVVFVTSFDARKPLPQDTAYALAKAALASYAASLRQALRGSGVAVTTVFPGRVDTPMLADLAVPAISAKIPASRVARAIARAMRRRAAEVVVPWHCRLLLWADVLSPRLGDWLVRVLRLDGVERAEAPKPPAPPAQSP
jgi:short-subunit dehydrogenase